VYLFGSAARATARPDSDVDVAILFPQTQASTLEAQPYGLARDLERYLGKPVDMVVLNSAPADLRIRVLRDHLTRRPHS
jgi:predicted nucleotidyltransferase